MTDQLEQSGSLVAGGIGLQVIASIHVVGAIALLMAIVQLWNATDPLGSIVEASFWVLLTFLLLTTA